MSSLILDSLEIHNFRAFDSLKIEKLGRVNLIVGKNNVGKSSVLEAIRLYVSRGTPLTIGKILGSRSEHKGSGYHSREDTEELLFSLKYLFYGYKDITPSSQPIRIGSLNSSEDTLVISINWSERVTNRDIGVEKKQSSLIREDNSIDDNVITASVPYPYFRISFGKNATSYPLDTSVSPRLFKSEIKDINHVFIPSDGLEVNRVGELWDNIELTPLQTEVVAALAIIAPGVEGVGIIGNGTSTRRTTPIVRIAGIKERIPIRNLGDGMQRILGIALALVNAKDGVLLIDEIENGLHYSVQPDMWRLIFRVARNLNVQVFATTHSWDCIEAFQKAAIEDTNSEGLLIRLEVKKSGLRVTLFDEEMLGIATEQQIEVR